MSEFTKTPNFIFDLMPLLSPAEFKVIMVVVRQTCGFHKDADAISLTQFEKMTKLSRQGVVNALSSLIAKGYVIKHPFGNTSKYSVRIVNSVDQSNQLTSQLSLPEVVNSVDYLVNSVDYLEPKLVNSVDTQKKVYKEKNTKEKKKTTSSGDDIVLDGWKDVQSAYENNIGMFTPITSELAQEATSTYGSPMVVDAIAEAVRQNVRKWSYVDGILKRWQANGRKPTETKPAAKQPEKYIIKGGLYGTEDREVTL